MKMNKLLTLALVLFLSGEQMHRTRALTLAAELRLRAEAVPRR